MKKRVFPELVKGIPSVRGDVLVAYCTDIAWSPFFPLLSGVVTELGGLISHGAVVAREYGIPCVVGASGATYVIRPGEAAPPVVRRHLRTADQNCLLSAASLSRRLHSSGVGITLRSKGCTLLYSAGSATSNR
ncbi:hypothetical protein V5799_016640 [Amblyomma americanum]|uniref:PEP-utilising enzyme mobile domain-containing protein n=1 Tax=Amblyomma americanum TaxID=6943 RepID=A0AAQ4F4J8_AMBAM